MVKKEEKERLEHTFTSPTKANPILESLGEPPLATGASFADLLRRPSITYEALEAIDADRPPLPFRVISTVQTDIKYAGYIKRQKSEIDKQKRLEYKSLPADIDYSTVKGLRLEAAQKLNKIRPLNIGQASRISGVNPADITVLLIYLGMN